MWSNCDNTVILYYIHDQTTQNYLISIANERKISSLVMEVVENSWHNRMCNVQFCLHESSSLVHGFVPGEPVSTSRIRGLQPEHYHFNTSPFTYQNSRSKHLCLVCRFVSKCDIQLFLHEFSSLFTASYQGHTNLGQQGWWLQMECTGLNT